MNSRDKPGSIIKDILKSNDGETLTANPSYDAMRQTIGRVRRVNDVNVKEAIDLKDVIVPNKYKQSYSGKMFLIDDSGDDKRVFLFSTKKNLKILSEITDWLGDGTFKILPLLFFNFIPYL
jgi:hypothetical protein